MYTSVFIVSAVHSALCEHATANMFTLRPRSWSQVGSMTTNMGWDAGEAPPNDADSVPEVRGDTWAFHNFALPEFRGIAKHLSRPQRHDLIKAWTNKVWLKDPRHLEHPRR